MRNTYVEISLGAIANNFNVIKDLCSEKTKICAVVKADAYGHGLIPVAQTLINSGVDYLAVAITEEGVLLREAGITTPILVLGSITEDQIKTCITHDLTITASSTEKFRMISHWAKEFSKKAVVHLKIDTGMGRIGVHYERATKFLHEAYEILQEGNVVGEGIYSHFADSLDPEFTKLQFERFLGVVKQAEEIGFSFQYVHICSSRSIFLYPEYHLSMVRPGVALYGIEPDTTQNILPTSIAPALSWKTEVVYFKVVKNGESVGYGRTWSPDVEYERIITLPVGYADGFPRRLSNCGSVIVRGKKYPIVGRVCMDQTMVSIGNTGESYLGDSVVILGTDGDQTITVAELALMMGGTPHEVTTLISSRVPRIYI